MVSKTVSAMAGAMAEVRHASWTRTSAPWAKSSTSAHTRVSPEITTTPSGVSTR
jgi:hypothetical protein